MPRHPPIFHAAYLAFDSSVEKKGKTRKIHSHKKYVRFSRGAARAASRRPGRRFPGELCARRVSRLRYSRV